ncbi:MAG: hypothetical protein ACUVUQ_11365 [Thermodesulfovibrionales bacterium]
MKEMVYDKTSEWSKISDNEYPPSVNWDNIREIEGVLIRKKVVNFEDRSSECFIIRTEDGDKTVWKSVGLRGLSAIDDGSRVRIVNLGFHKSPSTGRRFRKFEIYVKSLGPF